MNQFMRALSSEMLKLNRTLSLLVALALPNVVVLINCVMLMRRLSQGFVPDFDGWNYLLINNIGVWGVLMKPLYITLETALLGGLEHGNQGWKHLFALPMPRATIYAAKQIVAFGMVALSMIVLIVMTWVSCLIVRAFYPIPALWPATGFEWVLAMQSGAQLFLLSCLIVSIHTWVALRFPSFALASSVGIGATVMGFFIINDEKLSRVFPWALPVNAVGVLQGQSHDLMLPLAVSLIGAVLVTVIGGWDVIHKDVL
jgi:lantibiotic transport system permease protein